MFGWCLDFAEPRVAFVEFRAACCAGSKRFVEAS